MRSGCVPSLNVLRFWKAVEDPSSCSPSLPWALVLDIWGWSLCQPVVGSQASSLSRCPFSVCQGLARSVLLTPLVLAAPWLLGVCSFHSENILWWVNTECATRTHMCTHPCPITWFLPGKCWHALGTYPWVSCTIWLWVIFSFLSSSQG